MKKIILIITCLLFVFVSGCNASNDTILVDHHIKGKTSKAIDELFDKVTETIKTKDSQAFLNLCATGTEALNSVYFSEFVNNEKLFMDFFLEKQYENLSRYHIKDVSVADLRDAYVSEGYDFIVPNSQDTGERYIYIAEGEYEDFDIVFTAVFIKEASDWKVEKFLLGDIRPYGQSITSLIEKAKLLEAEGNLISAYMYHELAGGFVYPSPYIKFTDETTISDAMVRIAKKLNETLSFPLMINTSKDQMVALYAVTSKKYPDGFYCKVSYVSNLDEADATKASILAEAKLLHEKAKEQLIGLGIGFEDRILYTAYFEAPVTQGKKYESITVSLSN